MSVSEKLLKLFAKTIHDSIDEAVEKKDTNSMYGTVTSVIDARQARVLLDGSEIETPATALVSVGEDDRVLVSMDGRECTIIGNITNPSASFAQVIVANGNATEAAKQAQEAYDKSAEAFKEALQASEDVEDASKVATGFITIIGDNGVAIHAYNEDGNITGKNLLLTSDGVRIRDGNTTLAYFEESGTRFGKDGNFVIIKKYDGIDPSDPHFHNILMSNTGIDVSRVLKNDPDDRSMQKLSLRPGAIISGHDVDGQYVDFELSSNRIFSKGPITVEDHDSPIGTVITKTASEKSTSGGINLKTTAVDFNLSLGTWVINAWAGIPAVSDSTGASNIEILNGEETVIARSRIQHTVNNYLSPSCTGILQVTPTSVTYRNTEYVSVLISSSTNRTGVTVRATAVRIA